MHLLLNADSKQDSFFLLVPVSKGPSFPHLFSVRLRLQALTSKSSVIPGAIVKSKSNKREKIFSSRKGNASKGNGTESDLREREVLFPCCNDGKEIRNRLTSGAEKRDLESGKVVLVVIVSSDMDLRERWSLIPEQIGPEMVSGRGSRVSLTNQ